MHTPSPSQCPGGHDPKSIEMSEFFPLSLMGFGWDFEVYTFRRDQIVLCLKSGKQTVQKTIKTFNGIKRPPVGQFYHN